MIAYYAGRIFQLIGLLALPSAIWVGHFYRDERSAIAIFAGSFLVFYLGTGLLRFSRR